MNILFFISYFTLVNGIVLYFMLLPYIKGYCIIYILYHIDLSASADIKKIHKSYMMTGGRSQMKDMWRQDGTERAKLRGIKGKSHKPGLNERLR